LPYPIAARLQSEVEAIMRFEMSMVVGLLSVGAALLTRMQIQGFEAGLISVTAEYGLRGMRLAAKLWSGR
jgi:hypothetical protein